MEASTLNSFLPRLTPPTDFSTYYTERRIPVSPTGTPTNWQYFYSGDYTYTDTGAHTGNCTWYAMGRSAEIANKNLYEEFRGSYEAQEWSDIWIGNSAITSGDINFLPGDILIWANEDRSLGHVEIVEEVIGNRLTISYSAFSGYSPQSTYGTFFNVRYRNKPIWNSGASVVGDTDSYFIRNNGDMYALVDEFLIGVIHNPYAKNNKAQLLASIKKKLNKTKRRFIEYVKY